MILLLITDERKLACVGLRKMKLNWRWIISDIVFRAPGSNVCSKLKIHGSGTIFKFFRVKFNGGLHLNETISKNFDKQSKKKKLLYTCSCAWEVPYPILKSYLPLRKRVYLLAIKTFFGARLVCSLKQSHQLKSYARVLILRTLYLVQIYRFDE